MTHDPLPTPPATGDATPPAYDASLPAAPARRSWRDRLPSGRKAVAAGAVVAGLAIGGAGFGAGYAVGDDGATDTATQTGTDWDDHGYPGGPGGPSGQMGGQLGAPPGDLDQDDLPGGGTTGEAPDFDGDGQPDSDSGTESGTDTDSATQNS